MESEDLDIWDIFQKGPKIPMAVDDKGNPTGPKSWEKYFEEEVKSV